MNIPDNAWLMIAACFGCLVSGCIGYHIAATKERGASGFFVGLLLGPLGWLVAAFMAYRGRCSECRGRIPERAKRCMHCGYELYSSRS